MFLVTELRFEYRWPQGLIVLWLIAALRRLRRISCFVDCAEQGPTSVFPVRKTAGLLFDISLLVNDQKTGYDPIHEIPVMADKHHGSGELKKYFFE